MIYPVIVGFFWILLENKLSPKFFKSFWVKITRRIAYWIVLQVALKRGAVFFLCQAIASFFSMFEKLAIAWQKKKTVFLPRFC